ncbi:glyoxylate reductase NDAI_0E02510 [Naumovozyma dairenensis CBS 421]|uniref:D-isomer specific 2-hydroxyacid dehydrogenase NAD-binding domain-containing protein n=1 Tax=Naumovozyma dairenensis (strain ATCC 10597 / BCRC 20456 / CBS 421 / NBRC 0211 / NRRL Y-12639) TaxID=1071378 RepID=G0WBE8_NAUDC|nr:hypothetical protein NDAI_0E02510 [Naumovozyma dairenensis CBS 421]CCD25068.1 hypothetical protein NDAI_0E02510 [Naumovozyma dairenensis CBS 421]
MTINQKKNLVTDKEINLSNPTVIIPYKFQWEVYQHHKNDDEEETDPLNWENICDKINFITYEMSTPDAFIQFINDPSYEVQIDCIWITEEFLSIMGDINEYIKKFPSSITSLMVPWVGCEFLNLKLLNEKNIKVCNIGPHAANYVCEVAIHLVLSCFRMTSFWEHCFKYVDVGEIKECKKYIGSKQQSTHGKNDWPTKIDPKNELVIPTRWDTSYGVGGYDTKLFESPTNKSVLILGFGSIGQAIGSKLKTLFNMEVNYYKRSGPISKSQLGYAATYWDSLDNKETWYSSHLIILCLPSNESTTNLINKKTLQMCRDGVRIINVGRGACIDEDALLEGLSNGKIASCGLDVYKDETTLVRKDLIQRWDVTALPHIGSTSLQEIKEQTEITLKNIESFFIKGEGGLYPIN